MLRSAKSIRYGLFLVSWLPVYVLAAAVFIELMFEQFRLADSLKRSACRFADQTGQTFKKRRIGCRPSSELREGFLVEMQLPHRNNGW